MKTPTNTGTAADVGLPSGACSAFEQVFARFIIIQRDGLIATKKGPLGSDSQVTEYLRELPRHYPGATFTVAEITHGNDLWLTSGEEWLTMDEVFSSPNLN